MLILRRASAAIGDDDRHARVECGAWCVGILARLSSGRQSLIWVSSFSSPRERKKKKKRKERKEREDRKERIREFTSTHRRGTGLNSTWVGAILVEIPPHSSGDNFGSASIVFRPIQGSLPLVEATSPQHSALCTSSCSCGPALLISSADEFQCWSMWTLIGGSLQKARTPISRRGILGLWSPRG